MVTHRVLIESYRGELKHRLDARAVDAGGVKVDEAEVVIGAAGDQLVATRDHAIGEGLRVGENLLLIGEELGRRRLKGGDAGWSRDDMRRWSAAAMRARRFDSGCLARLLESGRERGDRMVVRPALVSREDGRVDRPLEIVPGRRRWKAVEGGGGCGG